MKIVGEILHIGEIDAVILDSSTEIPLGRVLLLALGAQDRSEEIMINRVPLRRASELPADQARAGQISCLAEELACLSRKLISQPGVFEATADEIMVQIEALTAE